MPPSENKSASVQELATVLGVDADALACLEELPAADTARLVGLVDAAIAERRHLVGRALDDAQRFLPGPLRRRISNLLRDG